MLGGSKRIILAGLCLSILAGCSSLTSCGDDEVRLLRTPTEHMVNNGIKSYEDGNYSSAMTTFQNLVANKDATKGEKVIAYKYMAFLHCVSSTASKDTRERMCRESFKKAFELNPNFDLKPAEAGHPVWGPVFSSVKHSPKK